MEISVVIISKSTPLCNSCIFKLLDFPIIKYILYIREGLIMELYNIGKNIQRLRKEKGLTQEELSAKAGISKNHLSRIETGVGSMSLDSLIIIANALNTTPDYILLGEYNITPERASLFMHDKLKGLTSDEISYIMKATDMFHELKVNRKNK